jgi:Ni2+-binding GTPase involved in maturation of urease and hydrogenase
MRLIITGGFLGSGKTTAIQQACGLLLSEGKRIAVITNDQGEGLVDTNYLRDLGLPAKEVVNGCFCCQYDQLVTHIDALTETQQPEYIFAESVGSCTDLVATIARPLLLHRPRIELIVSVFADSTLLLSLYRGNACFLDETIRYIYKKQLEEADLLVMNKTDLLEVTELEELAAIIEKEWSGKPYLFQNSLNKVSVGNWIGALTPPRCASERKTLELDYDTYGAGEARLAWLDEELLIRTEDGSAFRLAVQFIEALYEKVVQRDWPVGHLKFLLDNGQERTKISFTGGREILPVLPFTPCRSNLVSVLVNARIQTEPELLKQLVEDTVQERKGLAIFEVRKQTSFRPGYPRPTYRFV